MYDRGPRRTAKLILTPIRRTKIWLVTRNHWYTSVFYDLGGLDAGMTVHYIGKYWREVVPTRKIREWTTLDLF